MNDNDEFENVEKNGRNFCYRKSEPGKLLCRNCHSSVTEDMTRCPNCNNNLVEGGQNSSSSSAYDWYDNGRSSPNYISSEYTPISPLGYIGYSFLFTIPIVGWIISIIYAIIVFMKRLC